MAFESTTVALGNSVRYSGEDGLARKHEGIIQ
jgi:hypothetical protein